jgi:hypothetical protein
MIDLRSSELIAPAHLSRRLSQAIGVIALFFRDVCGT